MKVMRQKQVEGKIHILTNMVDNYLNSVDIYKRLSGASVRYLNTDIEYLGYVPRDDHLRLSVQKQIPVTIGYPGSQASYRFAALADSIENIYRAQPTRRSFSLFWRKLLLNRLKKSPGTIAAPISKQINDSNNRPAVDGANRPRFPKLVIMKIQQSMVQLVKSKTLSTKSMQNLLSSLIRQVERYYPEINMNDLQNPRVSKSTAEKNNVEHAD
jgi:hypothetical protein